MMIGGMEVFKKKLRELIVGERGSALALTLAFLLPTYLLVIGVYGVSETVHRKIELQNAADAAAYSAATVQADYLSRIAVLNKAVAWSYADMTRRQLDWAMANFTSQTIIYFQQDFDLAMEKNSKSCHPKAVGVNWNAGWTPEILREMWSVTLPLGASFGVPQVLDKFLQNDGIIKTSMPYLMFEQLDAELSGKGFLANIAAITQHALNITQCEVKLAEYIVGGEMRDAITKAANDIIDINTREIDDEVLRYVRVGDPTQYLTPLWNRKVDEVTLLEHALTLDSEGEYAPSKVFGPGIGNWCKRGSEMVPGSWRVYAEQPDFFHASWSYFWTIWWHLPLADVCMPPITNFFESKSYDSKERDYHASKAPYSLFTDGLPLCLGYGVPRALIYTLNNPTFPDSFFGKGGSIVVGLARRNTNPMSLFGGNGIDGAFDETFAGAGGRRPDYIWAISAARAAYNGKKADPRKYNELEQKLKSPEYHLDYIIPSWDNMWNLKETDWDAMFLPVRQANALAMTNLFFNYDDSDSILEEIMTDSGNWKRRDGSGASVDWSQLVAPGGGGLSGSSLDWGGLSKYLRH